MSYLIGPVSKTRKIKTHLIIFWLSLAHCGFICLLFPLFNYMTKISGVSLYTAMFEDSHTTILMRDKCFHSSALKAYSGNKKCDSACFSTGVRKYLLRFYEKVFYPYRDMLLTVLGSLCLVTQAINDGIDSIQIEMCMFHAYNTGIPTCSCSRF